MLISHLSIFQITDATPMHLLAFVGFPTPVTPFLRPLTPRNYEDLLKVKNEESVKARTCSGLSQFFTISNPEGLQPTVKQEFGRIKTSSEFLTHKNLKYRKHTIPGLARPGRPAIPTSREFPHVGKPLSSFLMNYPLYTNILIIYLY